MAAKKVADYRELLRSGRWFRGLEEPLQDALVSMGRLREIHPGNVLFARGQESNGMFAVLEGQLRACTLDDEGKQALLTIVEPPSWVGEIPLFDGLPRTHDLLADTEGLVEYVYETREPDLDPRGRRPPRQQERDEDVSITLQR